jgi:hypothetical protein
VANTRRDNTHQYLTCLWRRYVDLNNLQGLIGGEGHSGS